VGKTYDRPDASLLLVVLGSVPSIFDEDTRFGFSLADDELILHESLVGLVFYLPKPRRQLP
jgi:hypothetical protein